MFTRFSRWFDDLKAQRNEARKVFAQAEHATEHAADAHGAHGHTHEHLDGVTHTHDHDHDHAEHDFDHRHDHA